MLILGVDRLWGAPQKAHERVSKATHTVPLYPESVDPDPGT
jgi:hypothetical protein